MARITVDHCIAVFDAEVAAGALTNRNALESALAAPFAGHAQGEFYPTVHEKAARLGFGICRAHAFQDGNKRIAWLMTAVFLSMNGVVLAADQHAAANAMLAVASGEWSYDQFLEWLIDH